MFSPGNTSYFNCIHVYHLPHLQILTTVCSVNWKPQVLLPTRSNRLSSFKECYYQHRKIVHIDKAVDLVTAKITTMQYYHSDVVAQDNQSNYIPNYNQQD